MKRALVTLFFLILLLISVTGQTDQKKRYKASRITTAPVIDGLLDDPAWKAGLWVDDFTQHEPYNGRKASQRTEFKILFDDDNLYAGFKAYDTHPDSIVSRLSRRDNTDGDLVGIILDSFHDLRTGFQFGVSAGGVRSDQMFTDNGNKEDPSWDPNWWVKTSVNNEGWVAEMKIPFSQVRFDKNSGGVWGMEIFRELYRKNETSLWQHIPKDAPGVVHLFGELEGLDRIKPRKIFDITPYGVARTETFESVPENPFLAKGNRQGSSTGVDAKIGITNNMTMDLTINPDFGQVEADPSEVNLTAYETFFSEKRPFFIEGNNITTFGIGLGDGDVGNDNLFYSRRIGRKPSRNQDLKEGWYDEIPSVTTILGAAKLTGKTKNGLSVGFIDAVTAEEKSLTDTSGVRILRTVEPLTNYMVGRVQKDLNNSNTIVGGIFTGTFRDLDNDVREDFHKSAWSGGIDFTQYMNEKKWMLNINTAFSMVKGSEGALLKTQRSSARYYQRPDNDYTGYDSSRTSLAGTGGRMQIAKLNGHWNFLGAVLWRTPGFETNDLGYIREADQILSALWTGYNQWEPKGIYRDYNLNFDVYSIWNFGGDNVGQGLEANASMTLRNFWKIWSGGNISTSSLSAGILRGGPMMKIPGTFNGRLGLSSDSRKKINLEVRLNGSAGLEKNSNSLNIGIVISAKPVNYLVVSLNPEISRSFNELQYISTTSFGSCDRYIFGSIERKTASASFRINCNLTPDLTVQYWGQPFIASGRYHDYKYITNSLFEDYRSRFSLYKADQIHYDTDEIKIDENTDAMTDYKIDDNNFNIQELLSNFVVRWEYNPGSTIYFVWNQTRSSSADVENPDLINDLGTLFNRKENPPHNVFLIKFSYRFGIK